MNVEAGGETGSLIVSDNPIPKDLYHTDWVADHTTRWIDSMDTEDDWFCWMSFPDPHHPYDPPSSESNRVDWSDIGLDGDNDLLLIGPASPWPSGDKLGVDPMGLGRVRRQEAT